MKPRRWFDRKFRGSSIAEWSGVALLIVGGANAVGASGWAGKTGRAWHPLVWLVFLPMFAVGCAIMFWSLRRERHD